LQRTREGSLIDPEFIAQVRSEPIAGKLLRDFHREFPLEASLHVDPACRCLGSRLTHKLSRFTVDVRLLRVALRADRHALSDGHRHRSGDKTRHGGDQNSLLRRGGSRDPIMVTWDRDDSVVGPSTAARSHPARPLRCCPSIPKSL
jgi:hypothetical protein